MVCLEASHLGTALCGKMIAKTVDNEDEVTCQDCKNILDNDSISEDTKKRIRDNVRLFR